MRNDRSGSKDLVKLLDLSFSTFVPGHDKARQYTAPPRAVIGQTCSTRLPRAQHTSAPSLTLPRKRRREGGRTSQWPGISRILSPSPSRLVAAEAASRPCSSEARL